MQDFAGKVVVVTGAASGIGLALCRSFAAEDARVIMADIEDTTLFAACETIRETGADAWPAVTDVSSPGELDALAEQAYGRYGAVHVLCNNAGVAGSIGNCWDLTLNDWKWALGVNFWSVLYGIRAFVPRMLEGGEEGHIVNTSSLMGLISAPMAAPYITTKHAVLALSESLAMELQLQDAPIGVSVLCPAAVNTRIPDSERNRPSDLANSAPPTPQQIQARRMTSHALASGMPPDQVAGHVIKAIRNNCFYVLTHDDTRSMVRDWYERVAAGQNVKPPSWK